MSKSLYTTIIEETAPTTTTVGVVGQLYLDSTTKILYQCVAINIEDLTYEWKQIGGSSGSGKYVHFISISERGYNTDSHIHLILISEQEEKYTDLPSIVEELKTHIAVDATNMKVSCWGNVYSKESSYNYSQAWHNILYAYVYSDRTDLTLFFEVSNFDTNVANNTITVFQSTNHTSKYFSSGTINDRVVKI